MLPRYIVLEKLVGQTPLQAIEAWRLKNPSLADVSATYAGRLDPMASGKLLILLGDECKNQKHYHGLDKEYEIEVLLDLSTDTGDALGIPSMCMPPTRITHENLKRACNAHLGTHSVPYPAFSSKTINGKPLFQYALEGTLNDVEIPRHEETIHRIKILDLEYLSSFDLLSRIQTALANAPRSEETSKVLGADFRQDEIRAAWTSLLQSVPERSFAVLALRVTCASGTYMRTLAERLGKSFDTTGMALSIRRTKIGKVKALGPILLWLKEF